MHISQKCSVAIHCIIFLYEYGESVNVTSSLLAKSTGCNSVVIRNIVSRLKKAGILAVKSGVGNIRLEKEPGNITLYDICQAVEPDCFQNLLGIHSAPSQLCPVGRNIHKVLELPYDKIQQDLKQSLRSIHMKELIDRYHESFL